PYLLLLRPFSVNSEVPCCPGRRFAATAHRPSPTAAPRTPVQPLEPGENPDPHRGFPATDQGSIIFELDELLELGDRREVDFHPGRLPGDQKRSDQNRSMQRKPQSTCRTAAQFNQARGGVKTPGAKFGNDQIFDMGKVDEMSRRIRWSENEFSHSLPLEPTVDSAFSSATRATPRVGGGSAFVRSTTA
ncbi:MAG: hypothetical protein ACTHKU_13120, partial [Verrucomicrobiota bacterium]